MTSRLFGITAHAVDADADASETIVRSKCGGWVQTWATTTKRSETKCAACIGKFIEEDGELSFA